jgi:hypothetical protein
MQTEGVHVAGGVDVDLAEPRTLDPSIEDEVSVSQFRVGMKAAKVLLQAGHSHSGSVAERVRI